MPEAVGVSIKEVSAGLSAAQVLPALAGAILGIPGGIGLFDAVSPSRTASLPLWWMLVVLLATPLVIAWLTAMPARLGGRRPVAEILPSELAQTSWTASDTGRTIAAVPGVHQEEGVPCSKASRAAARSLWPRRRH